MLILHRTYTDQATGRKGKLVATNDCTSVVVEANTGKKFVAVTNQLKLGCVHQRPAKQITLPPHLMPIFLPPNLYVCNCAGCQELLLSQRHGKRIARQHHVSLVAQRIDDRPYCASCAEIQRSVEA